MDAGECFYNVFFILKTKMRYSETSQLFLNKSFGLAALSLSVLKLKKWFLFVPNGVKKKKDASESVYL